MGTIKHASELALLLSQIVGSGQVLLAVADDAVEMQRQGASKCAVCRQI